MQEKTIEQKLRDRVKSLGGVALKFVSPGHAGVFDRIVLMPGGSVWFVELKRPGKDLSPLQKIFRKQLDTFSMRYRVINEMQDIETFITELKREQSA